MRLVAVASATLALAVAATLYDPTPADARRGVARISRASVAPRRVIRTAPVLRTRTVTRAPKLKMERRTILTAAKKKSFTPLKKKQITTVPLKKKTTTLPLVKKKDVVRTPLVKKKDLVKTPLIKKDIVKAPLIKKGPDLTLKRAKLNPNLKFGKAKLTKMPVTKAIAGTNLRSGRLALPKDVTPKVSLIKPPQKQFHARMAPFVQRHWKKAFVWVAVAGIGYLTIPEIYYDRFLGYVSADDPDYEGCIHLLSQAALEEEDDIVRIRHPKPVSVPYKFAAKVAPEEVKLEKPETPATPATPGAPEAKQADASTCSFDPFIERNWSRPFVWVQIPSIGNVTVPEDYYDRFYGFAGAQPPNYQAACSVLVEASAADTVVATSEDFMRPEFR